MALFNKKKETLPLAEVPEPAVPAFTNEQIDAVIGECKYDSGDTVGQTLEKYRQLLRMRSEVKDRKMTGRLRDAMLIFVGSIQLQRDKESALEFLNQSLPYCRTDVLNNAVNLVAGVGFAAAKTVGIVGKVATLGFASKYINQAEDLTKKAITSESAELSEAWKRRLYAQINLAKELYGGVFSGEKEFIRQINEIKTKIDKI